MTSAPAAVPFQGQHVTQPAVTRRQTVRPVRTAGLSPGLLAELSPTRQQWGAMPVRLVVLCRGQVALSPAIQRQRPTPVLMAVPFQGQHVIPPAITQQQTVRPVSPAVPSLGLLAELSPPRQQWGDMLVRPVVLCPGQVAPSPAIQQQGQPTPVLMAVPFQGQHVIHQVVMRHL